MTEEVHRKWDIIFKWFGLVAVLASAGWTVHSYRESRASELEQRKYAQGKDEEARTKDQNSFIFQRQAMLYLDATRAAAAIATSADRQTLHEMGERFKQLYWGELVVVEDRRVELAMIAFGLCWAKDGKDCKRITQNQFGKPIDPAQIKAEPLLRNFALELAACTRSALKKDRGIVFGEVSAANTTCPYD